MFFLPCIILPLLVSVHTENSAHTENRGSCDSNRRLAGAVLLQTGAHVKSSEQLAVSHIQFSEEMLERERQRQSDVVRKMSEVMRAFVALSVKEGTPRGDAAANTRAAMAIESQRGYRPFPQAPTGDIMRKDIVEPAIQVLCINRKKETCKQEITKLYTDAKAAFGQPYTLLELLQRVRGTGVTKSLHKVEAGRRDEEAVEALTHFVDGATNYGVAIGEDPQVQEAMLKEGSETIAAMSDEELLRYADKDKNDLAVMYVSSLFKLVCLESLRPCAETLSDTTAEVISILEDKPVSLLQTGWTAAGLKVAVKGFVFFLGWPDSPQQTREERAAVGRAVRGMPPV
jgi:hypothetical protein